MAENKTKPTEVSVHDYIAGIENTARRLDAEQLLQIMQKSTGEQPKMWGPSIVGFGSRHYKYESGREGDTVRVGFSARKQALVLYGVVFHNLITENNSLLEKLGKHTMGKGCLYIKKMSDIDEQILAQMITNAHNSKEDPYSSAA